MRMLASWAAVTSWHLVAPGTVRTIASTSFCVLPLRGLDPQEATGSATDAAVGVAVGVGVPVGDGVAVAVDVEVDVGVGV